MSFLNKVMARIVRTYKETVRSNLKVERPNPSEGSSLETSNTREETFASHASEEIHRFQVVETKDFEVMYNDDFGSEVL